MFKFTILITLALGGILLGGTPFVFADPVTPERKALKDHTSKKVPTPTPLPTGSFHASFRGRVCDAATSAPIHGARVKINAWNGLKFALTDSEGFYHIKNALVHDTSYFHVTVSREGYRRGSISRPGLLLLSGGIDFRLEPFINPSVTVTPCAILNQWPASSFKKD